VANAPDVAAPNGLGGTWLIDPRNITIVAGADNTSIGFGNAPISNPFDAIADDAVLAVGDLLAALADGATVVVSTGSTGTQEGNITLNTLLDFNGVGANKTLTFNAANNININASIGDSISGNDSLNLVFNAGNTVNFNNDVVLISGDGGNVTITANNISLNGNTSIVTNGGNISFLGTVNGTAPGSQNLTLNAGSGSIGFNEAVGDTTPLANLTIESASNVNLNGNVTTASNGIITFNSPLTLINANTTLTADEINFADTVTGTGLNLVLQPATLSRGIRLGAFDASDDPTLLNLTQAELLRLQDGFSSITIGRSDGGGMAIAPEGVTFNDPVTLQSQSAIALNGNITGTDNASITLNGPTLLNAGNNTITTSGGNISFLGTVNALNGTDPGSQNLTLNAGSGSIGFNNAIGDTTPLGNLTIESASNVNLNDNVTTASNGTITFNSPLTLINPNTTLTADEINFNNPVSGIGVNNMGVNLVLQPATLNRGIRLGAAADASDDPTLLNLTAAELGQWQDGFNSITIGRNDEGAIAIAPGDVSFRDPVILQSQSAIALIGNITGTDNASITLNGPTLLNAGNNTITTSGGNIAFNGTVNALDGTASGSQNLTLDAGSGNITFDNAVGNARVLGILQANSTGTTRFNSRVNATSLTTNAGGTTQLNGDVTTSDVLSYGDQLEINSDISLTANEINFANTVTGTEVNLVLQANGDRPIQLGNTADISGNLNLTAAELAQLPNGFSSITIGRTDGAGVALATGDVTFRDPVILQSQNAIAFNQSNVVVENASITLNGPTFLNAGNNTITTSGGDISFNGTLNGTTANNQNLTLDAGSGNITFGNAVGNTTALGILQANSTGTTLFNTNANATSLTTNAGGTTQLNGDVITNGVQSYGDQLEIQSAISLISNNANVSFAGTVDSEADEANDLTINSGGGNITFNRAVGTNRIRFSRSYGRTWCSSCIGFLQ